MAVSVADAIMSGSPLVFGTNEVHVWQLRLGATATELAALRNILADVERRRADRFAFSVHRDRHVAAHGLLRQLISRYAGGPPASLEFAGEAGAKPRLVDVPGLRFSLSHSGDLALVAVAWNREVGVDIEAIRPLGDLAALSETCFSPAERAELESVPEALRLRAFFEGWTRKEAFLKAIGEGLWRPLSTFDVTLRPGEPARLLRVGWGQALHNRYSLWALSPDDGFVGALVAEGDDLAVRLCGDMVAWGGEWESDGTRGDRRHDGLRGGHEPRRAVLDLAGGEASSAWLASRGPAWEQGGVPDLDRAGLDGHDPGKPAEEVRAAS